MNFRSICRSLVFVAFAYSGVAQAQSLSTAIKPEILSQKTWTLAIDLAPSATSLVHKEDFTGTGVDGINSVSSVSTHGISLNVMKEFFESHRLSLSVLGRGTFLTGSDREISQNQIRYTQRAEGFQFGGGASLNLNFYGWGFGIQPYFSAEVVSQNLDYELDYRSKGTPVTIVSEVRGFVLQPSVGIRAFDPQTSIMSFLSLGLSHNLTQSVDTTRNINEQGPDAIAYDQQNVQSEELTFRAGFGFFF